MFQIYNEYGTSTIVPYGTVWYVEFFEKHDIHILFFDSTGTVPYLCSKVYLRHIILQSVDLFLFLCFSKSPEPPPHKANNNNDVPPKQISMLLIVITMDDNS